MPAPWTDIRFANAALAKFGGGAIATMADVAPPGPKVRLIYQVVADELFSYPWTFCKITTPLERVVDEAPGSDGMLMAGWRYAHALPVDRLAPPVKYLRDPRFEDCPVQRFAVQNELVYSDDEKLWAVVLVRPDESVWPPYFRTAFIGCLAANLVMPVSGNSGMFDKLDLIAYGSPSENRKGGLVGRAMQADAFNAGSQKINVDGLVEDWRS
jgi:hypothetical protein